MHTGPWVGAHTQRRSVVWSEVRGGADETVVSRGPRVAALAGFRVGARSRRHGVALSEEDGGDGETLAGAAQFSGCRPC